MAATGGREAAADTAQRAGASPSRYSALRDDFARDQTVTVDNLDQVMPDTPRITALRVIGAVFLILGALIVAIGMTRILHIAPVMCGTDAMSPGDVCDYLWRDGIWTHEAYDVVATRDLIVGVLIAGAGAAMVAIVLLAAVTLHRRSR